MISAKNLSDEQVSAIKDWAEDGAQLADIQRRLKGQYGLNVTYMDTRFLVLDLGIEIQCEESEESDGSADLAADGPTPEERDSPLLDSESPPAGAGKLQVTTDQVARPGAIISGTVTFSDGEKAVWLIDNLGRPGLDPDTPGYQPSEKDLDEFEKHLRAMLEG